MSFDSTRGFEPKRAIEEWKKAKPATLGETGVGELIRALPEAPAPGQLSKYVEIQGKLKAKMADPKIKSQQKAVKCIDGINSDISAFLKWYKESRASVIARMTTVAKEMKACQAVLEKEVAHPQKMMEAYTHFLGIARQHSVDSREFPSCGKSIFPQNIHAAWLGVTDQWCTSVSDTIKYLSRTPPPDPAAKDATEMMKSCKLGAERVAQVLALLQPI
jgi:hypothetical protein